MKTFLANQLKTITTWVAVVVCSFFLLVAPSYASPDDSSGTDSSTEFLGHNQYGAMTLIAVGPPSASGSDSTSVAKNSASKKQRPQSAPAKLAGSNPSSPNQQSSAVNNSASSSASAPAPKQAG